MTVVASDISQQSNSNKMCQCMICGCVWWNYCGVCCGGCHQAYLCCSCWLCKPRDLMMLDPVCCHICACDGLGHNCLYYGVVCCAPRAVIEWSGLRAAGKTAADLNSGKTIIINNTTPNAMYMDPSYSNPNMQMQMNMGGGYGVNTNMNYGGGYAVNNNMNYGGGVGMNNNAKMGGMGVNTNVNMGGMGVNTNVNMGGMGMNPNMNMGMGLGPNMNVNSNFNETNMNMNTPGSNAKTPI